MKILRTSIVSLFALPVLIHAQPLSYAGPRNFTGAMPAKKIEVETPEQARKNVIAAINSTRPFALGADDLSMAESQSGYLDYLKKMEIALQKQLRALETDDVKDNQQAKEKSDIFKALNITKSAACLAEAKDAPFARQKDLSGSEIVAFQLDQLKGNARYGLIEGFREGYARIKKDQVFGFLNYCGEEVITCQYQEAQSFNNGRALVKRIDWFFIDAEGKESNALTDVVDAIALKHGISIAKFANGKSALIDNKFDMSRAMLSEQYDDIALFGTTEIYRIRNGAKYGLMNIDGKVLLEATYEMIEPSGVDNLYRITQSGKVGLMDSEWKIKFPAKFDRIEDFDSYGLAKAHEGDRVRLINKNTFRQSELYKGIGAFNKFGLAQIQNALGFWGLINKNFQVIVEPAYFNIGEYNDYHLAPACRESEKCGFINTDGKEIVPPMFADLGSYNKLGVVVVREITKDCNKDKTCKTDWVFNYQGKPILAKPETNAVKTMKIRYEVIDSLQSDKYIGVKTYVDNDLVGYHLIEAGSYNLITAEPYTTVSPLDNNGLIRIKLGNLWGLIDSVGKVVLKPTYADIKRTGDGFYPVKNESEMFGFIDKKGKLVIPFEYDDVKSFRKGTCIVSKGKNKWGLINKFNAKIVPCYFQEVIVNDGTYDMIDKQKVTYTIDEKGDCVKNCSQFEAIRRKANQ
jgi:WG containing repeat